MNDDFLHRLRREPPPEFLDGLKAKLERQSYLGRTRPPRSFLFARGLIVVLLLGGAAFAVTWLLSSSRGEVSQQHRVVAWGPVWGPKRVAPAQKAPGGTNSAVPGIDPGVASRQAPPSSIQSTGPAPAPRYFGLTVVATPGAYPHAQGIVERLRRSFGGLAGAKPALETRADIVNRLCSTADKSGTDLIEMAERLAPEELRNCANNVTELKVGHQAIVAARSKLYGPMELSARTLFLALARQVPVATDPALFIDNPYITWSQIDPALPYDRIHLLGPGIGGVQGKLAAALLLAGCNTYPRIVQLRTTDPAKYEEICLTVRGDGAYEDSEENSTTNAERLEREPTLLGVFSLSGFDSLRDRLAASVIDGVSPSLQTVAAGTYPNSRTLYLYTTQTSYAPKTLFDQFINAYLTSLNVNAYSPGDWGFVPLNDSERADVAAVLHQLHPKQ